MCPPSSTGIGSRFRMPSWRLMRARSVRNVSKAAHGLARDPARSRSAPRRRAARSRRVTSLPSVWKTLRVMSTFQSTDARERLRRRQVAVHRSPSAKATPIFPLPPSSIGVTASAQRLAVALDRQRTARPALFSRIARISTSPAATRAVDRDDPVAALQAALLRRTARDHRTRRPAGRRPRWTRRQPGSPRW